MIDLISLSRIVNENYYRLGTLKTIDFYEGRHRLIRFQNYEGRCLAGLKQVIYAQS